MGWMRMMGAESVEYHRATVLGRVDDHPGRAMEYYASRGETPLVWGGSGASSLGLAGAVSAEAYEAVFGPGGARDPGTGEQLVQTRRPGMEIVIAAHKSVAELGVMGRAEEMHAIMDAEREPPSLTWTASPARWGAGGARPPRPRRPLGSSTPIPAMPLRAWATPPPTTTSCWPMSWR